MSLEPNWKELEQASSSELISGVFDVLQSAAEAVQNDGIEMSGLCELVPRLLHLRQVRPELKQLDEPLGSLARTLGLWNYLDELSLEERDEIVSQAARARTIKLGNRILHREQWRVFNTLLEGRNVILSAPTSFGKSLLIDVLLATNRYRQIAIIVPTLALLDEARRRLLKAFGDKYEIVSHHSEVPEHDRVIFIGTQERLIAREDMDDIDLLIVDEFYKLDPSRRDERSTALNAAVYKLLGRARQFFFLGPNIDSVIIKENSLWKFDFIQTKFATVAVDTLDLRGKPDREELLLSEARRSENWPALIFASSPDRANGLLSKLLSNELTYQKGSWDLAAWMKENFWSGWPLCSAIEKGCAVHHGRLPRALAVKFVQEFGEGKIGALVCTSTLIEGVNTAAKSVMIYDKKIVGTNYDFFTFANIRGRAGRLGQHYIGKVFLFNDPPDETKVDIDSPLFGDLNEAPDQLIIHFEPDALSETGNRRVEVVAKRAGLAAGDLQRFSSMSIDEIQEYSQAVDQKAAAGELPIWSGFPSTYSELEGVCELICKIKSPRFFGAYTYKQLAFFLSKLQKSQSIRAFYEWYGEDRKDDAEQFDQVFKFLKACEFGIGEYFSLVEALINQKLPGQVDYSPFVAEMKSLFRPECVKVLDERGIPMQISEKVYRKGDDLKSLSARLLMAAESNDDTLTRYERKWVVDALR